MKKIMYAGALLLALCFGLVTYSCSDDDDVTDFKSFVQGTWNAELVSVVMLGVSLLFYRHAQRNKYLCFPVS